MEIADLRSMRPKVVAPRSTQVDAPQPPCHSAPHARSMRPKANHSAPTWADECTTFSNKIKCDNHFVFYVYIFVYYRFLFV